VLLAGLAWPLAARFDPRHAPVWFALACLVLPGCAWLLERRRRSTTTTSAWLVLDDEEIVRVRAATRADARGRTPLARWDSPFGVSVLSNAARTRALLVFTTPLATRFLWLRLETGRDADLARDLLERAITVPDVDLDLATGATPDLLLGAGAGRTLLAALEERAPHALQRLYLSDARGTPVAVERDRLVIGEVTFDLTAPVEWRVSTFYDGAPGVSTLYQATAVKQGPNEVFLVCCASAELASWVMGRAEGTPPPREGRVAIDRLFMTPLRAALELAPRVPRPGPPSSRNRGRTAET